MAIAVFFFCFFLCVSSIFRSDRLDVFKKGEYGETEQKTHKRQNDRKERE